jgi:hypothetical protein
VTSSVLQVHCDVQRRNSNSITDANVSELAALAQAIDHRGAHAEEFGHLADGKQRYARVGRAKIL